MADTKISALTAATTPLAGTEVLPIVQSGVTKKVAVSDLTAGRAVSALSMTLTNALAVTSGGTGLTTFTQYGVLYASTTGALATSSGFTYDGTNVMVNAAPSRDNLNVQYKQLFYNTAGDGSANTVIGQIRSQVRNYGTNIATASFASIQFATDPTTWYKGEIRFLTNGTDGTDGVGTVAAKIDSAQNYVPQVAGKGINFTANTPAAGMTSQLLNWYEEGTWTPVPTASSGTITSYTSSGRYTRIGRSVVLSFQITITNNGTGAGILFATGMPFAANAVNLESGTIAEVAVVGFSGYTVFNTTTKLSMGKYDNTYPGGTNYIIVGQITYQI